MDPLVSLEQVDLALKLDLERQQTEGEETAVVYTDERVPDIEWKMSQATEIVIDFLKQPDHEWTVDDVPGPVSAAIILVIRSLLDDVDEPINSAVRNLLRRHRDPALR